MTGLLYAIRAGETDFVKVGFTTHLTRRLVGLQCGSPFPLRVITAARSDRSHEARVHALLERGGVERLHGEWFLMPVALDALLQRVFAAIELFEDAADDDERDLVVGIVVDSARAKAFA